MAKRLALINHTELLGHEIVQHLHGLAKRRECAHDNKGSKLHIISKIGGGETDKYIVDSGLSRETLGQVDENLRKAGYYISGACVSCSKCGQPLEPPMC